jgi:hypothetical protein
MKTLKVSKKEAAKVNEGDRIKLGSLFNAESGIVITKTDKVITVMTDRCFDIAIY